MMKILIAVDTGSASHEAALEAKRLFPNAEHLIVSAASIAPYMAVDPLGGGVFSMGQSMDSLNSSEDLAKEALVSAQNVVGKSDEDSVALGNPGQVICDQALDHKADVIVVGRSAKNWFSRIFDPSVSEYVVAHAPCPVLVVREQIVEP
jgi:nucleotide-binding universal stress UspA family protein